MTLCHNARCKYFGCGDALICGSSLASKKIHILLVAKHRLFGESLADVLSSCSRVKVKQASCIEDGALAKASESFDLIVLSVGSSPSAIRYAYDRMTTGAVMPISVIVENDEDVERFSDLRIAGVDVFSKQVSCIDFGLRISNFMANQIEVERQNIETKTISDIEMRLLNAICRGMDNKSISSEFSLTYSQVKYRTMALCRKLDLRNRTELAMWWQKRQLM